MFVLLPQCPAGDNWSDPDLNQPTKWLELTMSALAEVEKEFSIDPDRIYLTGHPWVASALGPRCRRIPVSGPQL
jgi:predicted peptidase